MSKKRRGKQQAAQTAAPSVQRSYLGTSASDASFLGLYRESRSGVVVDELTSLNLTTMWRAVRIKAADLMKLPLEVYKHNDNGKGKRPVYEHNVFKLLTRPNLYQTGRKLRFTLYLHLVLYGNAYAEIIRNEETGEPQRLELLDPRHIRAFRKDGQLRYKFLGTKSPYSGHNVLLAENVLHFTGLSLDGDSGISGVSACSDSIGLGLAVQQYASTLFANNAQPLGIVETPTGWDELARTNFRESWQQHHGGITGSNKVAILEEGAKFVATSFNPEQLQLLSVREFTGLEVARLVGIPAYKLEDYSHEASRTLSEAHRSYYEDYQLDTAVLIEDEITFKLFMPQDQGTYFVQHDTSALMRADDLTRAQANEIRMRNGVITWNEWRAEDGNQPFEIDGKVIPMNMQVVDDSETGIEIEPQEDDPIALPAPEEQPSPIASDVVIAARSIAREALGKIVRREAKNLRRHCASEIDLDWLGSFYGKELPVWRDALAPSLALYGIATGNVVNADQVVADAVERSRKAVSETNDLEALLKDWETNKANEMLGFMEDTNG